MKISKLEFFILLILSLIIIFAVKEVWGIEDTTKENVCNIINLSFTECIKFWELIEKETIIDNSTIYNYTYIINNSYYNITNNTYYYSENKTIIKIHNQTYYNNDTNEFNRMEHEYRMKKLELDYEQEEDDLQFTEEEVKERISQALNNRPVVVPENPNTPKMKFSWTDGLIFVAVVSAVGFGVYKKYQGKKDEKPGGYKPSEDAQKLVDTD